MTKINELARMWNALGTNGIFNNSVKPIQPVPKTQLLQKNSLKQQSPKETKQVTEHVQGFAAAMLGFKEEEDDESNNKQCSSEEEEDHDDESKAKKVGGNRKKVGKR